MCMQPAHNNSQLESLDLADRLKCAGFSEFICIQSQSGYTQYVLTGLFVQNRSVC